MMELIAFHCGSLHLGGKPKVLLYYSQLGIRVCSGCHMRKHGREREIDNQLSQINYMFAMVEEVQDASGDEWDSDLLDQNPDIEESVAHALLRLPNEEGQPVKFGTFCLVYQSLTDMKLISIPRSFAFWQPWEHIPVLATLWLQKGFKRVC